MRPDENQRELLAKWEAKLQAVFGDTIPSTAQWHAPQDIARVLSLLGGADVHVFLPTNGGDDLIECQVNGKTLEWSSSGNGLSRYASVVNPISLTFWHPGKQTHDANFVLEVGSLEPVGPEGDRSDGREEVVELRPGSYAPRSAWDNDEYRGEELPASARLLNRSLQPGRFAIFSKGAIYNHYRGDGFDAYDAFHNNPTAFEAMVKQMAEVEFDLS